MDELIKPVAFGIPGYAAVFSAAQKELGMCPGANEPLYDQQAIDTLRAEVAEAWAAADSKAGWEWKKRAERAEAEAEALRRDAERWRFCVERDAMPVIAGDGKTWCMFVSVTSRRRSLFTGKSPAEAVDAAIDAAKQAQP